MTRGTYSTPAGMRMALEERLNRIAKEQGLDVMPLRRQVAFDRLLSRLFPRHNHDMVMKGGYALELRMNHARTTKDVDLSFRGDLGGIWKEGGTANNTALQGLLQECTSVDMGDFFVFVIGNASLDLQNAPYGGYRFPVEARMAGRPFIRFDIDVASGDAWIEPHENVCTHDWFGFAGIGAASIPVISREQQFAEKLHAYTLPRETPNSRVKDLYDLYILSRSSELDIERVKMAVRKTFERRQTHLFPPSFSNPPESWTGPFAKLANDSGMGIGIEEVIVEIRKYCSAYNLIQQSRASDRDGG